MPCLGIAYLSFKKGICALLYAEKQTVIFGQYTTHFKKRKCPLNKVLCMFALSVPNDDEMFCYFIYKNNMTIILNRIEQTKDNLLCKKRYVFSFDLIDLYGFKWFVRQRIMP